MRLDIFCLGVTILKMLGKIRLYDVNDIDFYLQNIHNMRQFYMREQVTDQLKDFLNVCFEDRCDLKDLIVHPFFASKPSVFHAFDQL